LIDQQFCIEFYALVTRPALQTSLLVHCTCTLQALGDFCIEPDDVLENMTSNYVERGWWSVSCPMSNL